MLGKLLRDYVWQYKPKDEESKKEIEKFTLMFLRQNFIGVMIAGICLFIPTILYFLLFDTEKKPYNQFRTQALIWAILFRFILLLLDRRFKYAIAILCPTILIQQLVTWGLILTYQATDDLRKE